MNVVFIGLCWWSALQTIEGASPSYAALYWRGRGPVAVRTCARVAVQAEKRGADPLELIALSFTETRHSPKLVSDRGALGPLQILPQYWCRSKPCNTIEAGVRAWSYYRRKHGSLCGAVGGYLGSGDCKRGRKTRAYWRMFTSHLDALRRLRRILSWPR